MNDIPTPYACPGRCNAAWRAAEQRYIKTGIDHDLEYREGAPIWCAPCTTAIRAALADMPDLADALREEVESGISAAISEFVSGSKNRPVHDHEAASFLLDEIAEWIGEWDATVRRELGLNEHQQACTHFATINRAAELLMPHLNWQLAGRLGPEWNHLYPADWTGAEVASDFGVQLLEFYQKAQHLTATPDPKPVRLYGIKCPNCDRMALEWEVEGETGRTIAAQRYQYGADGGVLTTVREDENDPHFRPTKLTETFKAGARGMVTGYVRCQYCRPTFRMPPSELERWVKQVAASDEVRSQVTPELLAEIFGGSVPVQYRAVR